MDMGKNGDTLLSVVERSCATVSDIEQYSILLGNDRGSLRLSKYGFLVPTIDDIAKISLLENIW